MRREQSHAQKVVRQKVWVEVDTVIYRQREREFEVDLPTMYRGDSRTRSSVSTFGRREALTQGGSVFRDSNEHLVSVDIDRCMNGCKRRL